MNKIKFSPRIEKTLVVAGCSHTQGTAYYKSINHPDTKRGKTTYEFATQQLKEKYKKERFTTEWLNKNLTWGGMLGNLLEVDNLLNFAFGGMGIDAIIRAIYNYGVRQSTFRNHLFVIQIPSTDRKEVLFLEGGNWIRTNAKALAIQGEGDEWGFSDGDDDKKVYAVKYFDSNIYEIEGYTQLLHLQDYIESKGGQVRFIVKPFISINTNKKSEEDKYKQSVEDFNKISYHKEFTRTFSVEVASGVNTHAVDWSSAGLGSHTFESVPNIVVSLQHTGKYSVSNPDLLGSMVTQAYTTGCHVDFTANTPNSGYYLNVHVSTL